MHDEFEDEILEDLPAGHRMFECELSDSISRRFRIPNRVRRNFDSGDTNARSGSFHFAGVYFYSGRIVEWRRLHSQNSGCRVQECPRCRQETRSKSDETTRSACHSWGAVRREISRWTPSPFRNGASEAKTRKAKLLITDFIWSFSKFLPIQHRSIQTFDLDLHLRRILRERQQNVAVGTFEELRLGVWILIAFAAQ